MGTAGFVHLHTHSEFSILDGACRIKDIVAKAVEFEMPAVALTDHGAMYGNISFYSACKEAGIKPILGCEVYVATRGRADRDPRLDKDQYHLVLLAKSEKGYRNLIKLVSIAFSEGFYYKPRVDKDILGQYAEDLIALTACLSGEVPTLLLNGDERQAERALGEYVEIFGRDNVYVELMDNGLPDQQIANEALLELARRTGLPTVVSNDVHYLTREDSEAHDVLLCIQTGSTISDPNRMRFGSNEFYFKSPQEMQALFAENPESLANTLEIADRCNIEFDFNTLRLPNPGIPENVDPSEYMRAEALAGLKAKLGGELPEEYAKQFDYECRIIRECGFSTYMLIVRDFTDFARKNGILVGVRGSAAGSLVCYGLGITDVDPIEYGLTFERFLNPERVEMPDVDLDIQDDRREELIRYVVEKYGRERVSQIATFGSLKARAAVRDCGRVLGMELAEVDRIAKMIPAVPVGITIDRALEENPDLAAAYKTSPQVRRLLDTARSLEGLTRSVGVHAAGVLISDDPLTDHVPVQLASKGEIVAQMDKEDIKKIGLLKMDFLGLANLTILAEAVENVRRYRGEDIDIFSIPLDDRKTFEMLGRGDTTGVFQLEGAGMRRNVIELKPNSIRELAAIVALYRPGPMAHIPRFIRSKFGQEPIEYLHPALEPILRETYGVICYQDQVLRIAQAIAGFTLGQADVLRKAMSAKKRDVMEQMRTKFIEGAKANGYSEDIAAKIFEQIEPFAGYAFNKAHAVCYAFVAYRTAYMKANYPVEYYAALLNANMDDKDKLALYLEDCKRLGIEVLPPDVNYSGVRFELARLAEIPVEVRRRARADGACGNGTEHEFGIRFGLAAIKGCGRAALEAMVEQRERGGMFTDLMDFCTRCQESTGMNRSTIEALIKVGAFASIDQNRARLLAMLPDALAAASTRIRDQKSGQKGLFGTQQEDIACESVLSRYDHVCEFPREEILAMEKDLVGVYLSGHPLESVRDILERKCTADARTYADLENEQPCIIGGIITDVRLRYTRRNERMASIKVEDLYGTIPVTFFPAAYKANAQYIVKDRVVLISGKASHRERIAGDEENATVEVEILGETVKPIKNGVLQANGNGTRTVHIRINGSGRLDLEILKAIMECHSGESPVYFHLCQGGTRQRIATSYKVEANSKFVEAVERVLGPNSVRIT
ncbi:MAG: DNA polymerase III subunit alpha [Armatimonadota bacterium]|nr:DNA polymerase III subunit alpha [Armatimonadota bacterium]